MSNAKMKTTFSALMLVAFFAITAITSPAYADKKMDAQMSVQHMHVLINHAMQMASEGSNLVMLGGMGMATSLDEKTAKHGMMMIEHADQMIKDVLASKTMKGLHAGGLEGDLKKSMTQTHELAESANIYIKKLKTMGHGGHAKH